MASGIVFEVVCGDFGVVCSEGARCVVGSSNMFYITRYITLTAVR